MNLAGKGSNFLTFVAGAGIAALGVFLFLKPASAQPPPTNGNGNGGVQGVVNVFAFEEGTTIVVNAPFDLTINGQTVSGVSPQEGIPANDGDSYSITVHDPQGYQFVEWGNGSTSRTRSGTIDFTNVDFFSPVSYFTPVSVEATLDVRIYDNTTRATNPLLISGVPITVSGGPEGTRTSISSSSGASSFPMTVGQTYVVNVGSVSGWIFVEWQNGSTNPSRSASPTTPGIIISYNAYYDPV